MTTGGAGIVRRRRRRPSRSAPCLRRTRSLWIRGERGITNHQIPVKTTAVHPRTYVGSRDTARGGSVMNKPLCPLGCVMLLLAVLALAACGGSDTTASSPPSTAAGQVTVSPSTAASPTGVPMPTPTVASVTPDGSGLAHEARLDPSRMISSFKAQRSEGGMKKLVRVSACASFVMLVAVAAIVLSACGDSGAGDSAAVVLRRAQRGGGRTFAELESDDVAAADPGGQPGDAPAAVLEAGGVVRVRPIRTARPDLLGRHVPKVRGDGAAGRPWRDEEADLEALP